MKKNGKDEKDEEDAKDEKDYDDDDADYEKQSKQRRKETYRDITVHNFPTVLPNTNTNTSIHDIKPKNKNF